MLIHSVNSNKKKISDPVIQSKENTKNISTEMDNNKEKKRHKD